MHQQFTNITLISNNSQRVKQFGELLRGSNNKVKPYSFDEALQKALFDERQDLVVLDCPSSPDFDYRQLDPMRNQQALKHVPFIFILNAKQDTLKKQIYHNPQNKILIDPIDKFSFVSSITNAIYTSQLERRLLLYKELVEGEKKLISNMDQLLELNRLQQFSDQKQIFDFIKGEYCRKLELTLAVESVFYLSFYPDRYLIDFTIDENQKHVSDDKRQIQVKDSIIWQQLLENFPYIFEADSLSDPFIQKLEEALGFNIAGLLFVPISILHEVKGAVILVNKLYRNEFTENDLAFTLISSQKIVYHLEYLYLRSDKNEQISVQSPQSAERSQMINEWKLFKHIMNSVYFGAIVFNEDFQIRYMNKAAREILQISAEPEQVLSLSDTMSEYEFNQMKEKLADAESGLPLVRQELHIKGKENEEDYYIGYSIYPFNIDSEAKQYTLIFSEISQTKRIQAEIIRMDRMASLGILSAGIAHEIRNPLAGIKAMAQTLEEDLEEGSAHSEYVERILRQVNRLDELLKAFFSYTNPHRPEPKPMQVHKIIKNVMPLFERRIKYEDIVIEQSYAQDLYEIFVDENQIEQVFINFFLNAFDAVGKSGKIEITAKNAHRPQPIVDRRNKLSAPLSNRYIRISIKDSGVGIPPGVKEKIFDPFFTTKSNGTGLGLSIVYQIIREHGGQVEVYSEMGRGTEFVVLLPAYVNPFESAEFVEPTDS
ncbi:MAG: hypothetical protein JXR46_06890 [Calditrichaceae bacterium]|nr:hypothetical protein [Calditrichaceae bacterium]MBN2708756.1 hypothetical protein [Calditrichaceae bacterium]RQV97123.1 MAG: hypothetical protein EH224_02455 [Calditrichota bacterium]